MITADDTRIHGLGTEWAHEGDGVDVNYVYPGSPTTRLTDAVSMAGVRPQVVRIGTVTADPDTQDLLDERFWRWPDSTSAAARIWARHVLAVNNSGTDAAYEHDGTVTLVLAKIPTRAVELELLREGFQPALATWTAPASPETRAAAKRLAAGQFSPSTDPYVADASAVDVRANAEHAWMRWCATFDDRVIRVGERIYQRRRTTPYHQDDKLVIEYSVKRDELRFTLNVALHPVLYDIAISARRSDADWVSTRIVNLSWEGFREVPKTALQLVETTRRKADRKIDAAPSAPLVPEDMRISIWESVVASTLSGYDLPASTPLYALAHQMAVAGAAALDALIKAHGPTVPKMLSKAALHRPVINEFRNAMETAFAKAPSKQARQALVDRVYAFVRDGEETKGESLLPGTASEEFWRTWMAPPVLVLAKRRYQLRQHEVYFSRNFVAVRYGAGPGGDTPSIATLRLQIGLPDREGKATVIATHLVKGASAAQSPAWDLTVPELEELTGDAIEAQFGLVKGEVSTTVEKQPWDELLVETYETQDSRDPQLRLERRLGSGARVFVAFVPGREPEALVARIAVAGDLEIEDIEAVGGTREDLAAVRQRIEAALDVVRSQPDPDGAHGEDYMGARKAAISELVPLQVIDRLAQKLAAQREEATLEALRLQARADLGAASRVVASLLPPSGPSPTEVASFLGLHDLEKSAALLSAYIFTPSIPLTDFAVDLAASIDTEFGTRPLRRGSATNAPSLVPHSALRNDGDLRYVLEATGGGVRRHQVVELHDHRDGRFAALDSGKLPPALRTGDIRLYINDGVPDNVFTEVWQRFDALIRDLGSAPAQLAEFRQLLAAAAVLIDVPKCQGRARENALAALQRAREAYDGARQQIHRGRDARALDRLQQALRQVAEVAHQSAASCSSGQGALVREELQPPAMEGSP